MRKAVAMRWLLAAMSLAVFFPSYWYGSMLWLVALGAITAITMEFITKLTKERPAYLKPAERPRPLDLATARRTRLILFITLMAMTLLMVLMTFGGTNFPLPREPLYYFVGFIATSILCLLLPLKSLENHVTEHNEWLRRMSPSPDSLNGD